MFPEKVKIDSKQLLKNFYFPLFTFTDHPENSLLMIELDFLTLELDVQDLTFLIFF